LYHRAAVISTVTAGDATVLLDVAHGRYFTLNPVAGRVWELLASGIVLDDLLTQLHREFDVPPDLLRIDVVTLIRQLDDLELIAH
jgi:hypothetical protein